jgi:hypothetical protein
MQSELPRPAGYLTDSDGNKTSVILSIEDYEELLQDIADLALIAERRDEDTMPHDQFVRELERDGKL